MMMMMISLHICAIVKMMQLTFQSFPIYLFWLFSPNKKKPRIQGGHITYKTRNIRKQNRSLDFKKGAVHLKFDSEGNPLEAKPSKTLNKVRNFLGKIEMGKDPKILSCGKINIAGQSELFTQSDREPSDITDTMNIDGGHVVLSDIGVTAYKTSDQEEMINKNNSNASEMEQTDSLLHDTLIGQENSELGKNERTKTDVEISKPIENDSDKKKDNQSSRLSDQDRRERRAKYLNAKLGIGDLSRYFSSSETNTSSDQVSAIETESERTENIGEKETVQVENVPSSLVTAIKTESEITKNISRREKVQVETVSSSQMISSLSESERDEIISEEETAQVEPNEHKQEYTVDNSVSDLIAERDSGTSQTSSVQRLEVNKGIEDDVLATSEPVDQDQDILAGENHNSDSEEQSKGIGEDGSQIGANVDRLESRNNQAVKQTRKARSVRSKLGIGDLSQYFSSDNSVNDSAASACSENTKTVTENTETVTENTETVTENTVTVTENTETVTENTETVTENNESEKECPKMTDVCSMKTAEGNADSGEICNLVETEIPNVHRGQEVKRQNPESSTKLTVTNDYYNLEEELEIGESFDDILNDDVNIMDGEDVAEPTRSKKRKKRRKINPMPAEIADDKELRKYWGQRYRLFSKFDDGIKMDRGKNHVLNMG